MHSSGEIETGALSQNIHTRASLLERVRDWSDDASWQDFFDTYSRLIYSLALKAGLSDRESEEVVQATMIAVAKAMPDFEYKSSAGSFKAWLCAQAKWKINDHFRRGKREQEIFLQSNHTATSTGTGTIARFPDGTNEHAAFEERDWNEAMAATALAKVKALVKPKHFQIFDLYVIKQWPLRRISRTLNVNVPQVYLIKSRVSHLLKKQTRQVKAQLERLPRPGHPNQKTQTV